MIGSRLLAYDVVESTNDLLKSMSSFTPHGTVVWALEQTRGRGRFGRKWFSPKGGLWFSVLIKGRKGLAPYYYTMLFSLSVIRFLEKEGVEAGVKWPNDIYIGHKKIGGILVESVEETRSVLVVGVGLNVNNPIPDEIKERAINLRELVGREYALSSVLKDILSFADRMYSRYIVGDEREYLTIMWKRKQILKKGAKIRVRIGMDEKTMEAELLEVEPTGLLLDIGGVSEFYSSVEVVEW